MVLAVLFTVLTTGLALALASRRRIHRAILALVAGGIASGAFIGSIPGAILLLGLLAIAASGPSGPVNWAAFTTLAAVGTLAGIAIGAYGAGAVSRPHVDRVALRAASTALFAILGVVLSIAVLLATPNESTSGALFSLLCLLITATSTLGFVLPPTRKR